MNQERMALVRIRREIEEDLEALKRVGEEYRSIPDDVPKWMAIRTKASLLHDFYTGLERIFSRVASELNGGVPNTEQWHRDLLRDMSFDLEGIRPPVITLDLYKSLVPYLRFRHLFRNLYGFELDEDKMSDIDSHFPETHSRAFSEITAFLGWLMSAAEL